MRSLFLIILLVAAGAFVTAPWFAFRSLRDAAKTNDVPALAGLVDYNAVSQSLADELSNRPVSQTPAPDIWHDPLGALKHVLTPAPAAPPQEPAYVSPKGLYALTEGRSPLAPPPTGKPEEPFPMIAYWGPDRCRITVADPAEKTRHTEFTFQRKGIFNWRLTRIVLPGKAKTNT